MFFIIFPIIAVLIFGGSGYMKYKDTKPNEHWCLYGGGNKETRTGIVCTKSQEEKESTNEEVQRTQEESLYR